MVDSLEKLVSLAKRRGFVYPGSEIYGGLANSWDYGPLGVELKNNIKQLWWKMFVQSRDDMVGIDAALVMNPKVWEASGHLETFSDPLIECRNCHARYRLDNLLSDEQLAEFHKLGNMLPGSNFHSDESGELIADSSEQRRIKIFEKHQQEFLNSVLKCENCHKSDWTLPRNFNLMLKTFLGPAEDATAQAYFRPETAQAMFVDFASVVDTSRKKLPFGIAQIGKAFRNEITPGNFIFRTREFEQMEIEFFFKPPQSDAEWQKWFDYWHGQMVDWMKKIGLDVEHSVHELEVSAEERAHYSKRTVDFEFDFPFGRKELYGLAYRTDFDLANHGKFLGQELKYMDQETGESYYPHVIEPTWGVDRTMLAVLCQAYTEEPDRVVLKLSPKLAPYKAAVFPLLANKPELVAKARGIYESLRPDFMVAWDDRGNIGKRYKAQDEIGTPMCITVDFDSLEDDTVTIRDRDTQQQDRVKIDELSSVIAGRIR